MKIVGRLGEESVWKIAFRCPHSVFCDIAKNALLLRLAETSPKQGRIMRLRSVSSGFFTGIPSLRRTTRPCFSRCAVILVAREQ